jgi:hypothetical protein
MFSLSSSGVEFMLHLSDWKAVEERIVWSLKDPELEIELQRENCVI